MSHLCWRLWFSLTLRVYFFDFSGPNFGQLEGIGLRLLREDTHGPPVKGILFYYVNRSFVRCITHIVLFHGGRGSVFFASGFKEWGLFTVFPKMVACFAIFHLTWTRRLPLGRDAYYDHCAWVAVMDQTGLFMTGNASTFLHHGTTGSCSSQPGPAREILAA